MRLAYISLYQAHPAVSGAASVTFNCAYLSPCVTLLIQLADRAAIDKLHDAQIVSIPYDSSSRLNKLLLMPYLLWRIRREIHKFVPDYIVLEGATWAVYLLLVALTLYKPFSSSKIIYHAHNVEYLLRKNRSNKLIAFVTMMAEYCILTKCTKTLSVSKEDCRRFASLYGFMPSLLPNCVDCSKYQPEADAIEVVRHKYGLTHQSILFTGLYGYQPNTEAINFLLEQVLPQLYEGNPNIRLVITGGGPPISKPWLINTGIISRRELDAILHACQLGIAPIFKGSGTRLKILEYMAAGLPVITTQKGAEGLNLENGKHALYAETPTEFKEAVLYVLSHPDYSKHLSNNALLHTLSTFNWRPILLNFINQLKILQCIQYLRNIT